MNPTIDPSTLSALSKDLFSPDGIRIVLFLVMFGYMMKMIPVVPNRMIPSLNCFLLGPGLSFLMMGWPSNGDINPNCRWPELCAYSWAYQRGFLLGLVAWFSHGLILKRVEDALSKLGASTKELNLIPIEKVFEDLEKKTDLPPAEAPVATPAPQTTPQVPKTP